MEQKLILEGGGGWKITLKGQKIILEGEGQKITLEGERQKITLEGEGQKITLEGERQKIILDAAEAYPGRGGADDCPEGAED